MSKKKDPIVGVMEFFRTASLETAQAGLSLAYATVRARTPPAEKKGKRGPRAARTQPINQATPIVPPTAEPVPTPPTPRESRRRRSTTPLPPPATPPQAGTPALRMPGLGPSTIGD